MRPLKYRVWSKELGNMVYFTLGQLLHSYNDEGDYPEIAETDLFSIHQDINPDETMQFTGLADKNGKEVYVGDLVRAKMETADLNPGETKTVIAKVEISESGLLMPFWTRVFYGDYWWIDHVIDGFEIFGNIYQNPELVPDKK